MIRLITAVVCVALSAAALAEPPKAVITGRYGGPPPTKVIPGEVNVLNSIDSVGDRFTWKVRIKLAGSPADEVRAAKVQAARKLLEEDNWQLMPPPKGSTDELWSMIEGKRQLLMPSLPGTYHVILAASNPEDVDIAEYDLVIEGTPCPVPVPPTPIPTPPGPTPIPVPVPVPDTSLSGSVAAAVAKAVTAANQAEFLTLAETYSRLGALAENGTIPTVEALTKTTEVVTAATVINGRTAWAAIEASVIAPKLVSLQSTADYSAAWKAIAAGIKAGAGAQPPPPVVIDPPVPSPGGVRVFVRYDANNLQTMPSSQAAVLDSIIVREWLDKNTPVLEDGKHAYRFWHEGIEIHASELDFWKQTNAALKHQSLPWLFISNGAGGYSGPLPQSVADTVALLNKHL